MIALLGSAPAAYADAGAPGLFGVHEIVIEYVHFLNPQASADCGLVREDITQTLNKVLQDEKIPATPASSALPQMVDVARVSLIPEIATINTGLDCISWVSLRAQSKSNVHVPPVDVSRNVTIDYWHDGVMVNSGLAIHQTMTGDSLQKMAVRFAREYRVGQPPALPTPNMRH